MNHKSNVTIRAMREKDYSFMVKWLNNDRVIEYYGPRLTLEQVIAKYGPRLNGELYVKPCIVEYKDEPIGYMQYYKMPKEQLKLYGYSTEESIYGMDQFIGEPQLWGKGIGTQMMNTLLEYLSSKIDVSKVVLDVQSTNIQAIKCYEKCGFHVVKELENDYLLMERVLT